MRRIPTAICCLALIAVLTDCGHDTERFYSARADAEKGGEFTRGWLPDFLPKTSHKIHLAYDLSPSEEWCGFEFDPLEAEQLLNSIEPLNPAAPPIPAIPSPSVQWWPKFLEGDLDGRTLQRAAQSGVALYSVTRRLSQVQNVTLVFAIDRRSGRAYFYGH